MTIITLPQFIQCTQLNKRFTKLKTDTLVTLQISTVGLMQILISSSTFALQEGTTVSASPFKPNHFIHNTWSNEALAAEVYILQDADMFNCHHK